MVDSCSGSVIINQRRCLGLHGIPLLRQPLHSTHRTLPHVTGGQSSLPVPRSFKCPVGQNGASGPKVSRPDCRTGGRYGGEKRDSNRSPSERQRPCEDRESAERDGGDPG